MLLLTTTTDKLQVVTGAAITIDVHASFVDLSGTTVTPGRQNTAITTATTTDIVAAPGASTSRNIKGLHLRNKHASLAGDVTILYNANATTYELFRCTLFPGDCLEYVEGVGFFVIAASASQTAITTAEASGGQLVLKSDLNRVAIGTFLCISGTAYYVYVGRVVRAVTALFVEFHVTTAGAGAQTAEVGLFTTADPPDKAGQSLTKLVATGTVDSLTTTGVKRNTSSFAQPIPANTHLWAVLRTAMATTQPTVAGLAGDMSQGHINTTTGGGALTGLSTATGTLPALGTATVCPDLRVTLV